MPLVFDCLCWNLDFCLSVSCLSNRFYTGFNRFCTSLSLISVSGHRMFAQLPRCSYVSPDWSRGPTAIPQAFPSCRCVRLRLTAKTLKAKDNDAINIVASYSRLKMYGISTDKWLCRVFRLPGYYACKDEMKLKFWLKGDWIKNFSLEGERLYSLWFWCQNRHWIQPKYVKEWVEKWVDKQGWKRDEKQEWKM